MSGAARAVVRWFDTWEQGASGDEAAYERGRVDWVRILPFLGMHVGCALVLWVGWSPVAVGVAVLAYLVRMFGITAFYHRYFSHRTYSTSRAAQFVFAVIGASATQRGALWWAAHHRIHHRVSDTDEDTHSPVRHGFLWSHVGWFTARENFRTRIEQVPDLARFPELRFLDRFDLVVPLSYAALCWAFGAACARWAPSLGTDGAQMLVWAFFVSTVVLFHATFTINSLAHLIGTRPYPTGDESRNHWALALLTLGEGWHNNHHWYPGSVRQGFRWWQVDVSWYGLRALALLGIVWDLHPVPAEVVAAAGRAGTARDASSREAQGAAPGGA